ncbi:hypothetical protein [Saccharomonospora sp. CUA-673]|uniref:hypothetical protein n=1 Tax=Saccharomonospora sp. CUA-673 TaxID=1904969 RepID=UPI0011151212|nr:hypothetical protein [Saccharomonospora sp. CUA-673]
MPALSALPDLPKPADPAELHAPAEPTDAADLNDAAEQDDAAELNRPAESAAILAPEPDPEQEDRAASEPRRRRRHDTEHGSVTARSVLDRLGISASGGGRRRASAEAEGREPTPAETSERGLEPAADTPASTHAASRTSSTRAEVLDSGAAGASVEPILAAATAYTPASTPEQAPEQAPESTTVLPAVTDHDASGTTYDGADGSDNVDGADDNGAGGAPHDGDTWLPRLKLPPPLLPLESLVDDHTGATTRPITPTLPQRPKPQRPKPQ